MVATLLLSGGINAAAQAQLFPPVIDLGSLSGADGFRMDGVVSGDRAGGSVSAAGDINGDGIDDLIIGADGADPNGDRSGSSYVVFGQNTASAGDFAATLALSDLDGSNGFRLDGVAARDYAGYSVSAAGDINGDGLDDLIIGAFGVDLNGSYSGSSYVVFGRNTASSGNFAATLALSSLDGSNGFRIDGVAMYDFSGRAVSAAGDINGDGLDDLIIGANRASPNGNGSGSSYVVFGKSTPFAATLALSSLDGSNGFRIDGVVANNSSGSSVGAAGDINGDGIGDLFIGANSDGPNGTGSGSSYVVFGQSTPFAATLALSSLDGSNGFRVDGAAMYDYSGGAAVSAAGDVNGDGVSDLIIGASGAGSSSGSSYVVFGQNTASTGNFAATLDLSSLNGSNGFRLDGVAMNDSSGRAVSAAGDINGDGLDDLIIGASTASPNGAASGSSYVVFGQSTPFAATLALSSLDGGNGFRLDGVAEEDFSGDSVSAAGDINGDGVDDVIIGANGAGSGSGSSYVVFGRGQEIFDDGFE
jgi:hypothetical protein